MNNDNWKPWEDLVIREGFPKYGTKFCQEILADLGTTRTRLAVKQRGRNLGLSFCGKKPYTKKWSAHAEAVLREHYPQHGADFCLQILQTLGENEAVGKNAKSVSQHANGLGLHYIGPPKGRWKAGQPPANKGKAYNPAQHQNGKLHRFKTGHVPHTWKPIGSEAVRDGYRWVKVAEGQWEMKHRLVWKAAGREIPDGFIVVFCDGNPTNFDLDNLMLVSRAEHCVRNRWQVGAQEHSLATGRAARASLLKMGIPKKIVNHSPELVQLKAAEKQLKSIISKSRQQ